MMDNEKSHGHGFNMEGLSKIQVQVIRIEVILVVNMELEGLWIHKGEIFVLFKVSSIVTKKSSKEIYKASYKVEIQVTNILFTKKR